MQWLLRCTYTMVTKVHTMVTKVYTMTTKTQSVMGQKGTDYSIRLFSKFLALKPYTVSLPKPLKLRFRHIQPLRPNQFNIRFLVSRPRPLTAGRVPCVHAQLNYVTVACWMYISSVAT